MLSLAAIHNALITDPSLVFVQTTDGQLIPLLGCYRSQQIHVYSGSFNPLHDGHKAIFSQAKLNRSKNVAFFELSINRFDKAPVTVDELALRLRQFVGYAPVLITNVAKFVEKAGVLRGTHKPVFHVGGDTMTRLLDHSSIQEIAGFNCEFVYYNRIVGDKKIEFPAKMPVNCFKGTELSEDMMKISSTSLRNAGKVLG